MNSDDKQVGRLYSRREILALLGASGAVLMTGSVLLPSQLKAGRPTPCIVRPQQSAGPYYTDSTLNRSDIRIDPETGEIKPGIPLALTFVVTQLDKNDCKPLPGAQVDIWQCDAHGVYSDVRDSRFDTRGQKFLRGYRVTDPEGVAHFTTIYPGWYPGRAVHIHFKIRTEPADNRSLEFTSQLYFDDTLTDTVHQELPYSERRGERRRNRDDMLYRRGGDQLKLNLNAVEVGYSTEFDIALHI